MGSSLPVSTGKLRACSVLKTAMRSLRANDSRVGFLVSFLAVLLGMGPGPVHIRRVLHHCSTSARYFPHHVQAQ